LIRNYQDIHRWERRAAFMYIVESHPEKLHSKVLEMLQSSICEDFWDGRVSLQLLQKKPLLIQEREFEGKRCSRLLERHDLSGT